MIKLRERHEHCNKTNFPKILIAAGSPKMPGAGLLACRTSFRMGAGYVYHFHPKGSDHILHHIPEIIPYQIKDAIKFDAALIGSGNTIEDIDTNLLTYLIKQNIPLILDAGALDFIKKNSTLLHSNCLLTPHFGEAQRLSAKTNDLAKVIGDTYKCQVLLKGKPNQVYFQGHLELVNSGNAALATAGSGDVLAAILTTTAGHIRILDLEQIKASIIFHGQLAINYTKDKSLHSLTASDLVEQIPLLLDQYSITMV